MSKNHKYLKAKPVPTKKQKITIAALIAAIVLVLILIIVLLVSLVKGDPAPTEPTETTEVTQATEETTEATEETEETVPPETKPEMLPHMKELYEKNPDTVGWIRIDGTKLDYPLMFVPEDEERYIHANFEGKYDYAGLPFIDKDCSLDPESQNLIIYGHNMTNGTGFRTLMYYQQENFWREHPTIYLSTLYEEREYEIISCFFDRVYYVHENCFKFYQFIDPPTEDEFNVGRDYFKTHSMHEMEQAVYGDTLITLVTCAYHVEDGRFVVVARLIEDEPAESETTAPKT